MDFIDCEIAGALAMVRDIDSLLYGFQLKNGGYVSPWYRLRIGMMPATQIAEMVVAFSSEIYPEETVAWLEVMLNRAKGVQAHARVQGAIAAHEAEQMIMGSGGTAQG